MPSVDSDDSSFAVPSALPSRIVGIGASAGGLEAFSYLLRALPPDSGMAFVLLSHLSPTHISELVHILSPLSRMPVRDATDGDVVKPNRIYVLPPDRILIIADGQLRLRNRGPSEGAPTVIDQFLESLAVELGPRAVGVILSGTGSDGTRGLQAIKAHGGTTYAQDPVLAPYGGMPKSAIQSGAVDFTLPLDELAEALTNLAGSPGTALTTAPAQDPDDETVAEVSPGDAEALDTIITTLQLATGVDFHHYKPPSLTRRIRRRAEELGLPDLPVYLARLQQDPAEVTTLFHAVLIHVTRFFREPETFEALKATVIPALLTSRSGSAPLRIWVVGCSTGEEAYSLAMSLLEVEGALGLDVPIRIFASDVSEPALATARLGHYPAAIIAGVSADRLERFFTPIDQGYRVIKRVREMCVFAHHDITRDPPFAQLDLILCSNVLIYFDPVLQRRLFQNMHYALKPNGYLVLGPAETAGGVEGLFSPVDRKHKFYLRRAGPSRPHVPYVQPGTKDPALAREARVSPAVPAQWSIAELQRAAEGVFLAEYPSGSVIVNPDFNVLRFQGATGPYLQSPSGAPTVQLLRLAHPDLRLVLGRMLGQVKKDRAPVRRLVPIAINKQTRQVNLSVLPISLDDGGDLHFLVVFDPAAIPRVGARPVVADAGSQERNGRVRELERELRENQEYLQAVIDQQDATHEELQAAYEASLSVNEEYQSTNEELESAKEEMQSLNEELTTVNEQMQQRNAELQARTSEVSSLLEAMDMPILLLTRDLRLRAFNSRAAVDFNLTVGHIGQAVSEGHLPFRLTDLQEATDRAFQDKEAQEREYQDGRGGWRALRVWPVGPDDEGGTAALALIDITKLKEDVAQERAGRTYSEAIVETVLEPLVVVDGDFRMLHANQAFHRTFGTDQTSLQGKRIWELEDDPSGTPDLADFLKLAYGSDRPIEGPEVVLSTRTLGKRSFRTAAGRIIQPQVATGRLLLALEDITARRQADSVMIESSRMQAVGQLAGGVAHEINNQMTAVLGFAAFLLSEIDGDDPRHADVVEIEKAARRSAEITQQLLAFSRRQILHPVVFDLNLLVAGMEALLRRTLGPNVALEIVLGNQTGQIRADKAQVEQVLVNLSLNARDAMQGNGQLTIQTTKVEITESSSVPRGSYARLIVRDTGVGMDAGTMARIFEPFFTTKSVGEGTGLGLASVFGVVKQSGGQIGVESKVGQGTTFKVDFPQIVVDAPVKPAAIPSVMPGNGESILVVDDEDAVRTWLSRSLRGMGYQVLEASNAGDGLRMITEQRMTIDLVISDIVMPGIDGYQFRNRLMELRPGLPFLGISGYAMEDLIRQGKLDSRTAFLNKPFNPAVLAARIRELLDTSRTQNEVRKQ